MTFVSLVTRLLLVLLVASRRQDLAKVVTTARDWLQTLRRSKREARNCRADRIIRIN
jgi:hypothetical protein